MKTLFVYLVISSYFTFVGPISPDPTLVSKPIHLSAVKSNNNTFDFHFSWTPSTTAGATNYLYVFTNSPATNKIIYCETTNFSGSNGVIKGLQKSCTNYFFGQSCSTSGFWSPIYFLGSFSGSYHQEWFNLISSNNILWAEQCTNGPKRFFTIKNNHLMSGPDFNLNNFTNVIPCPMNSKMVFTNEWFYNP